MGLRGSRRGDYRATTLELQRNSFAFYAVRKLADKPRVHHGSFRHNGIRNAGADEVFRENTQQEDYNRRLCSTCVDVCGHGVYDAQIVYRGACAAKLANHFALGDGLSSVEKPNVFRK